MDELQTKIRLYNEIIDAYTKKVCGLGYTERDKLAEKLGVFAIIPINKDTIKIFEENCCKLDEESATALKNKINDFESYKIYGKFLNSALESYHSKNVLERTIMLNSDSVRYDPHQFNTRQYISQRQTELRKDLIDVMAELICESNPEKTYYDSTQDTEILTNTLKALLACSCIDDLKEEDIVKIANIDLSAYFLYDKNVVNRIAEYFELEEFGWEEKAKWLKEKNLL